MSRPTHILRHEHRIIEQGLRALDGICFSLKTGDGVPAGALSQILDFIRNFTVRYHHAREETYLFPVLSRFGFQEDDGALVFLRDEHKLERGLVAELEQAVDEYRMGNQDAAGRFIESANQIRDHLIAHIQKEDTILFRMAEEMIDEETKSSLIRGLAEEKANGNGETIEKYERLAGEMERHWAV